MYSINALSRVPLNVLIWENDIGLILNPHLGKALRRTPRSVHTMRRMNWTLWIQVLIQMLLAEDGMLLFLYQKLQYNNDFYVPRWNKKKVAWKRFLCELLYMVCVCDNVLFYPNNTAQYIDSHNFIPNKYKMFLFYPKTIFRHHETELAIDKHLKVHVLVFGAFQHPNSVKLR